MRGAGLLLLLMLPFATSFPVASVLYIGGTVLNRGTSGPRSALSIGLVRPYAQGVLGGERQRCRANSALIGPVLAGICYDAGWFSDRSSPRRYFRPPMSGWTIGASEM